MRERLLQIIPADGWVVVYKEDDGSELKVPLTCWGLFATDGGEVFTPSTFIDGIDMDGADGDWGRCGEVGNFLRYERA